MSLAWNGMETRDERVVDVAASLPEDRVDDEEDNEVLRAGLTSWDKRKRRVIAQFCFFMMEVECWKSKRAETGFSDAKDVVSIHQERKSAGCLHCIEHSGDEERVW